MNEALEEDCVVLNSLKTLGRKWTLWILIELMSHEDIYFSDLLSRIKGRNNEKISARVLSESLSNLEDNQIVVRTVISDTMPIRVKYSLSEKGRDLKIIFGALLGWVLKWEDLECCTKSKQCQLIQKNIPFIDPDEAGELLIMTNWLSEIKPR